MLTDEYKEPKKAKSLEKVPVSDIVLGFSSNNQIKDNLKADVNFFPTNQHEHYNASAEFFLGKRELNKSNLKLKSTDVIETMQKIEEHGTTTESSEIDKNEKESLKKIETKYPIPFLRFDHKTGLPS